jgi:uncharacterized surface protein with fasciclin (FAS1) repeats
MKVIKLIPAALALSLVAASPAMAQYGSTMPEKNIVETAVSAGSFTTLVAAVQAAGLVDVLSGEGPFTVFAPTDEAFAKLPEGTIDALLADKEKLTAILTYHVVPGAVMAADVVKLSSAETVQGSSLTIKTDDGVMVDNAKVVTTDIEASNGVIHVIDTVLMPSNE